MPVYVFRCERCGVEHDLVRSLRDYAASAGCPDCGLPMERLIRFEGHMAPEPGESYFHHGLGKVVSSKKDVRDEVKRVKDETGRELIEVGNEKIKPEKPKTNWDMKELVHEYKKALK